MSTLTAATWVTAFLLIVAGARKAARPAPTGAALHQARLPSDPHLVRALGLCEIGLGVTVLTVGGAVPTTVLGVLYGGFALFARRQRRSGAECGCFGTTGTPVTRVHVWLNVLLACVALGAATAPGPALPSVVTRQPLAGAAAGVLVVIATAALRLLLTAAPDLTAALALHEPDGTT